MEKSGVLHAVTCRNPSLYKEADVQNYIPPLAVSRMIGSYHFEGGGYVAVVGDGNVPTSEIIEAVQEIIDRKRRELEKKHVVAMEVDLL